MPAIHVAFIIDLFLFIKLNMYRQKCLTDYLVREGVELFNVQQVRVGI